MFSVFPPKADLRPVAARAVLDAEIRQGADCISARPAAGPGRACGRAVPLRCRWCDFGYSCGGGATVGSGSWESARRGRAAREQARRSVRKKGLGPFAATCIAGRPARVPSKLDDGRAPSRIADGRRRPRPDRIAPMDQVQAKAPAVRNACNFDYGVAPPGRRTVDTDPLHGSLATGVAADPSRSTNAREKHN